MKGELVLVKEYEDGTVELWGNLHGRGGENRREAIYDVNHEKKETMDWISSLEYLEMDEMEV
jgi:hypothetical protein